MEEEEEEEEEEDAQLANMDFTVIGRKMLFNQSFLEENLWLLREEGHRDGTPVCGWVDRP